MGYMANSNWFSQFEQDAMATYLVAAYFHNNNNVYKKLVKKPGATRPNIVSLLSQADALEGAAIDALQNFQNATAVSRAKQAHALVLHAADTLGVDVQPATEKEVRDTPPASRKESRKFLRELKKSLANSVDTAYGMGVDDVQGAMSDNPMLTDSPRSRMADRPVPSYLRLLDTTLLRKTFSRGAQP